MIICTVCRREVKAGQRVLRNYSLEETDQLTKPSLQHANCFDGDGPRFDESGKEITETAKGYLKP